MSGVASLPVPGLCSFFSPGICSFPGIPGKIRIMPGSLAGENPEHPAEVDVGSAAMAGTGKWTSGCCECFQDIPSCCLVLWCPCVAVGRIAEMTSDGRTGRRLVCCAFFWTDLASSALIAIPLGFLISMTYRTKLRMRYNLPEEPCGDCCTHFCCLGCALCQEYRELKNRGWDPALPFGFGPNPPEVLLAPEAQRMQQ